MMETPKEVIETQSVEWLQDNKDELTFVDLSQDVKVVQNHVGGIANDYDSFFTDSSMGEYTEVWGMNNVVPYMHKRVYKIV